MINGMPHQGNRRSSTPMVIGIVVAFVLGIVVGQRYSSLSPQSTTLEKAIQKITGTNPSANFDVLTKTWELVQSKYVKRPIDSTALIQGATEGLVRSLNDPYSYYLTPKEAGSFSDELNGKFDGIGAELGQKDGKIVVIAPLDGTPAQQAGIRAGDVIKEIDGTATDGMTLDRAVEKIRGPEGTTVVLTIIRGAEAAKTVSIKRAKIQVKSVTLTFKKVKESNVALITISSFTQTSAKEFIEAVQELNLKQPAGIVIDMRNNSGGYLDAAVDIADEFISEGPVVIEDFGNGKKDKTDAKGGAPLAGYKVVVLINGGSASAAEILAGALEDRIGAVTVGEKSFGKGSVQELESLSDGSTVKLTIAHWLTPNGRSIDGKGITPKIVVEQPKGDQVPQNDVQLDRAVEEVLKK